VFRALERAGNRLKNQHPRTDVTAMPVHTVYMALAGDADHLLEGAWDCAPDILSEYSVKVPEVTNVLDFYVRGLISQHRKHNRATLGRLLSASHLEAITADA